MRAVTVLASLLVCGVANASSASPVAYNTILVIVSIELIFAFMIGVVCILFSFNLLRALKDASPETLSAGDLPPRSGALADRNGKFYTEEALNQTNYNPMTRQGLGYSAVRESEGEDLSRYHDAEETPPHAATAAGRHSSVGSEWDFEQDMRGSAAARGGNPSTWRGALSTFTSYIKPW